MSLSLEEVNFIAQAREFFERPSFLIRASTALGRPIENMMGSLPEKARALLHRACDRALKKGLIYVVRTLDKTPELERGASAKGSGYLSEALTRSRKMGRAHQLATFASGAAGGFFGLWSLPVELPITTSLILRSIAATAREFGFDINDPQVQLECLFVLGLGAGPEAEATETAYWSSRAAFSKLSSQAVGFLAKKSAKDLLRELESRSSSVLLKLLSSVAGRFEVVASEKAMAEALPIVGAIGGGTINAAFAAHYNQAARFHFGMRALEEKRGREVIEGIYSGAKDLPK